VLKGLAETRQPLLWAFKIEEVTKVSCHSKMLFRKKTPFLMGEAQLKELLVVAPILALNKLDPLTRQVPHALARSLFDHLTTYTGLGGSTPWRVSSGITFSPRTHEQ